MRAAYEQAVSPIDILEKKEREERGEARRRDAGRKNDEIHKVFIEFIESRVLIK